MSIEIGDKATVYPDHVIAIGKVEATEDYQFAFYVDGWGQLDTVMTPQEHGMVSRVIRRALKEYKSKKKDKDDNNNR